MRRCRLPAPWAWKATPRWAPCGLLRKALGRRMQRNRSNHAPQELVPETASSCALPLDGIDDAMDLSMLATLKPLGQIRDSFILAVNPQGLWIIDQHVAHERVLFEKILEERGRRQVEAQRLLMPIIVELRPAQQAIFTGDRRGVAAQRL